MLARATRTHRSLIAAARSVRGAGPDRPGRPPAPLFATLRGGLGVLPGALAAHITRLGGTVRAATTVREARRAATGWRLTLGSAHAPEHLDADAVIVAVPARPAARLLASEAPAAATELAAIDYASMAIVTLAYAGAPAAARPDRSGYLVPAVEERAVKAVTFSSAKWPHLDASGGPGGSGRSGGPGEVTVVRCSIGRYGEEHVLQRDDTELVDLATAELAATHGLTVRPVDTRVTRWGGGLPQYTVGHLGRVDRIRQAVARVPGLAVCGAAYDGLGIPACVATAKTAAGRALDHLGRTVPATRAQAGARGGGTG
jgi:protoporphyrinogen/coproporphyrinogen III oxidase